MRSPVHSWRQVDCGRSLDGSSLFHQCPGSLRWAIAWWLAIATGFLVGLRHARSERERKSPRLRYVRPSGSIDRLANSNEQSGRRLLAQRLTDDRNAVGQAATDLLNGLSTTQDNQDISTAVSDIRTEQINLATALGYHPRGGTGDYLEEFVPSSHGLGITPLQLAEPSVDVDAPESPPANPLPEQPATTTVVYPVREGREAAVVALIGCSACWDRLPKPPKLGTEDWQPNRSRLTTSTRHLVSDPPSTPDECG